MSTNNLKFYTALLAILVYESVMIIFHLDGLSLPKLAITVLVWFSFFVAFKYFLEKNKAMRRLFPSSAYLVLLLLLIWNVFGILRSVFNIEDRLTTIFGSIYHVLALLVPFVIVFAIRKDNLRIIHSYYIKLLKLGVLLFIVFFAIAGGKLAQIEAGLLFLIFSPVVFLITMLPFEIKKNRILILLCAPLLFYAAYALSIRTMMIREIMLFLCLLAVYSYAKYNFKWILRLSFLLPLVPVALLLQSHQTGVSIFQELGFEDDSSLKTDTRTFLYQEVFEDLIDENELIVGKGANGRYFSKFFTDDLGIIADRETPEVGILGILLKGGMIAVVLNLALLLLAIFYAFFRSRNHYVVGAGFMLLVFVVLLFIENLLRYTSYNLWIWFFTGICLSRKIRSMDNMQIYELLHPQKKSK